MKFISEYTIETELNTYSIRQHENGIYCATRINMFDDNDVSATTARTMSDVYCWIKEEEQV